jgi:hypothetical protein
MKLAVCPACGKETKNPRFCDRSCAAKFNNQKSPKRKPEGKCRGCGQPLPTSKSLCANCTEEKRVADIRKSQNIKTWVSVAKAERVERVIPKAYSSSEMVFRSSFNYIGRDLLTSTDKIDLLLDRLTSVCFSRPQYLRKSYAARHVVLLNDFREHRYEDGWRETRQEVRSGDQPIDALSIALNSWINRILREDGHPLMPSYALDTIIFIQEHVQESFRYDRWKIEPLVASGKRDERVRFIDASFKREFTQQTGTIFLLGRVPMNGRIVESGGSLIAEGGSGFLSTASRCHLSSGVGDHIRYVCEEDDAPAYDLHRDFAFYGSLIVHRTAEGTKALDPAIVLQAPNNEEIAAALGEVFMHHRYYSSGFETPAHWVEATVSIPPLFGRASDSRIETNPVPTWDVEFES